MSNMKFNQHHIDALVALEKAGQPVEKTSKESSNDKLTEVFGGMTPYELEEVVGPNWASYHVVMDLLEERLIGYKVQVFGDYGKYFLTESGKKKLEEIRLKLKK